MFLWFLIQVNENHTSKTFHQTDAIVVLTGGSNRIETGIALLDEKISEKLFISGVHDTVKMQDVAHLVNKHMELLPQGIELGYEADDTVENAEETKEWIEKNDIQSITLVTAHYHLPRSMIEFRKIMPHLKIIPYAVQPNSFDLSKWWDDQKTCLLLLYEYHKYLRSILRYFFATTKDI